MRRIFFMAVMLAALGSVPSHAEDYQLYARAQIVSSASISSTAIFHPASDQPTASIAAASGNITISGAPSSDIQVALLPGDDSGLQVDHFSYRSSGDMTAAKINIDARLAKADESQTQKHSYNYTLIIHF